MNRARARAAIAGALAVGLCLVAAWLLGSDDAADGAYPPSGVRTTEADVGSARATSDSTRTLAPETPVAASRIASVPFSEAGAAKHGSVVILVRSVGDDRPLVGARIRSHPLVGEAERPLLQADADGRVVFDGLAFGLRKFTVSAVGFAARFPGVWIDGDRVVVQVTTAMTAAEMFVGQVLDDQGFPAVGAQLRSLGPAGEGPISTDERGAFSVPVAWRQSLCVESPGHLSWFGSVPWDDTIRLVRERRPFRGVVRKAGIPFAGARLVIRSRLHDDVAGAERVESTTSDGDGTFDLGRGMPGGPVAIEVSAPGCRTEILGETQALLMPADGRSDPERLIIDLLAADLRRGRVLESDGSPVGGAQIYGSFAIDQRAYPFSCVTDVDGRFEFFRPTDADYWQWHVYTADGRQQRFLNPPFIVDDALSLRLDPASFLVGLVTDAATGTPVPGARIVLFDGWMHGVGPITDAGGAWRSPRPHRDQVFVVTADGYLPEKFTATHEGPPGEVRHDVPLMAAAVVVLEARPGRAGGELVAEPIDQGDTAALKDGEGDGAALKNGALFGSELGSLDSGFAVPLQTKTSADDTGYARLATLRPERMRIVLTDRTGVRTILAERVFSSGEIVRF